ncbi:MAG: glutamine--fructose-6-phosphate transaminase (isomerizing) [Chitinophagaceae bacterium]|nr:glutamine--fructose-6-phosphate transaminase (isomerizing) [Chitinophagaceae bacterium]
MCGIVGYVGKRKTFPILLKGLKRLEYRGYDSAGIGIYDAEKEELLLYKKKGKVSDLETFLIGKNTNGTIGIGHTRWATHGEPNDVNAHPHISRSGSMLIVHNGIIENYYSIKQNLTSKGFVFQSDTDTEVLIHFIEDIKSTEKCNLYEAVRLALCQVAGAYAIVVLDKNEPDTLIAARKGSPLLIGVGKDEFFIASDASPIIEYTKEIVYLDDEEVAEIKNNILTIKNLKNEIHTPYINTIELSLEALEKGGYEHFMLKEIFEQPISIANCMRGRLKIEEASLFLGGIREYADQITQSEKLTIVACGTSWHAGLIAEYIIEEYCRICVEVEYASEFRYRNPIIKEGDIIIAISQSGETADTLAALELAKSKGAIILGVVNAVGSSIARITNEGVYLHAGPEIGVASTKAFTAQVLVLIMIALRIAHRKGTLLDSKYRELLYELHTLPDKIKNVLQNNDAIQHIAKQFYNAKNFIYLGRGTNFPVALEGALKLKEISYIHAEGYPAAEMKHGPIALIDTEMPVVFIAPKDSSYQKILSNIQEVKARKGKVIAIITENDKNLDTIADYTIEIPKVHEIFSPIISVIPLQLLAYHIAILRGCNVDQPRNLAKSVTVE